MTSHGGADNADVSLSGNLEDVPLADVLQFIHLGRRTGTLSLSCDDRQAEIGFHNGQIVSAKSPTSHRLGERLVELGIVDRGALEHGLEVQKRRHPRQSIGSILVTEGLIDGHVLRRQIETQIAETVYELVTWTHGVFKFTLDELRPVDDIGMFPGDLIPHIDLNTQMVLLEATRIFDERNRAGVELGTGGVTDSFGDELSFGRTDTPEVPEAPEAPDSVEEPGAVADDGELANLDEENLSSLLAGLEEDLPKGAPEASEEGAEPEPTPRTPVRVQVLTADGAFYDGIAQHFKGTAARAVRIRPHEAGIGLHGEAPPIVVFDLRQGTVGPQDIRALRRSRPRAPIIAAVDDSTAIGKVIEAGALTALPAEQVPVVSCVESILRNRFDAGPDEPTLGGGAKAGLQRLRRILSDLRSGLLSATVALNLLHIISESVERAILFLVMQDELKALGAFGFSRRGELLAQATGGFKLPRSQKHPLNDCVEDGQVLSVSFDEAGFPQELVDLVGPPETGQVVLFPVLGAQRVIAVIYADNGETARVIEDIELLELATAQVGMAFENELLRRQAENRRRR